jgi:hypothetical protein
MIKIGSQAVFGAFREWNSPVKRNALLPLLKKKWKVEVTEVYTRKIFSAPNITLNID